MPQFNMNEVTWNELEYETQSAKKYLIASGLYDVGIGGKGFDMRRHGMTIFTYNQTNISFLQINDAQKMQPTFQQIYENKKGKFMKFVIQNELKENDIH
eukprot:378422_1